MPSAQLYTLCFQALWSSGSENYNLWEAVCITLYGQNPNATFKIRFWVFTHGLWMAGSSEHRVTPSKLMKRGWKYPLEYQEGGEGTPFKDSKLGALSTHSFCESATMQWVLSVRKSVILQYLYIVGYWILGTVYGIIFWYALASQLHTLCIYHKHVQPKHNFNLLKLLT